MEQLTVFFSFRWRINHLKPFGMPESITFTTVMFKITTSSKMWLISFTTVLLLERWGGSAGTSDSTQKAAPSARNCSDVQHFPGFALWLPLPFHTVNLFFVFVYFFSQVIWTPWCHLQKYIIIQWFWFLLGPVCNITRPTRIMKTMNSNCRSNLRWSAISTRSKEATFSLVNCLIVSTCDWLNYAFPFLVESKFHRNHICNFK